MSRPRAADTNRSVVSMSPNESIESAILLPTSSAGANCAEGIYFHGLVWDRSKPAGGPFCTDPDGNLILDLSSHGAAFPLGYNNSELIETATRAAAVNPGRYGAEIVGAWGDDPEAIDIPTPSHLAQKVISLTKPYGLDTLFMSNSGSEAVENAMKLCYDYRRNMGERWERLRLRAAAARNVPGIHTSVKLSSCPFVIAKVNAAAGGKYLPCCTRVR